MQQDYRGEAPLLPGPYSWLASFSTALVAVAVFIEIAGGVPGMIVVLTRRFLLARLIAVAVLI